MVEAGFGSPLSALLGLGPGWNLLEPWGVWSAAEEAVIPVLMPAPGPVRLRLLAPIDETIPTASGSLVFNRGETLPFVVAWPDKEIALTIPWLVPDPDGVARIRLVNDRVIRPTDLNPAAKDSRMLGLGFLGVDRLAPDAPIAIGKGWHRPEDWGSWAAGEQAEIMVARPAPGPLRLRLVAPLSAAPPERTGRLVWAGGSHPFRAPPDRADFTVECAAPRPDDDGILRIGLISDQLIRPADVDAASQDRRPLGFGLVDPPG